MKHATKEKIHMGFGNGTRTMQYRTTAVAIGANVNSQRPRISRRNFNARIARASGSPLRNLDA